jgi:hypothetical protein
MAKAASVGHRTTRDKFPSMREAYKEKATVPHRRKADCGPEMTPHITRDNPFFPNAAVLWDKVSVSSGYPIKAKYIHLRS